MTPKPKTILFVAHSLRIGGIEQLIARFAVAFIARGWQVHVAVFLSGGVLEQSVIDAGGTVHDLAKKEGFDTALIFRMRRLIRGLGVNVIHTNNYSPWIYAGLAAMGLPTKLVHTEHSIAPGNLRRRFIAERMLSWITDAVVAVSADVKTKLVQLTRIDARKVFVICNGIDTETFGPANEARTQARDSWGAAAEAVIFGTVGRLVPVKDQATLLRAFAMLRARCDRALLILIGDGELREPLQAQAQSLGIAEHVRFLGQRQDISSLMPGFDVFMLSSESEGLSVSLLEAMACALPAIVTRTGGNPELVKAGKHGELVAVGDAYAMEQAMFSLATDSELRERLGAQSRHDCIALYSFRTMLDAYEALYLRSQGARP